MYATHPEVAGVLTPLQEHQQHVVDRLSRRAPSKAMPDVARRIAAETPEGSVLPERAPKKGPKLKGIAQARGARTAYEMLGLYKRAEDAREPAHPNGVAPTAIGGGLLGVSGLGLRAHTALVARESDAARSLMQRLLHDTTVWEDMRRQFRRRNEPDGVSHAQGILDSIAEERDVVRGRIRTPRQLVRNRTLGRLGLGSAALGGALLAHGLVSDKTAEVRTELKPHQQRVVDRLSRPDQPGLVAIHGLGSGKTLSAIAATDALDMPTTAIVPASLRGNFRKELDKHLDAPPEDFELMSLPKATRTPPDHTGLLILDEAHRLRDPASKGFRAMRDVDAQKRLLLTASPTYNHPSDIAPLVNLAAGHQVLPQGKAEFERRYVRQRQVDPGLFARLFRGVKPGVRPELTHTGELKHVLDRWTDYYANPTDTADFPSRTDEVIPVPMSRQQRAVYDSIIGAAPAWMQYKIRSGLPPSKAESKDLNAFLTGARQAQLYPGVFQAAGGDPENATKQQAAFERFHKALEANPDHRAVVYSNYLDAGLSPYRHLLDEGHIPYAAFTGDMKSADREQAVRDYNEGKLKALLISSAGGEGLDLKGTRQIQILEPHFNAEKLKQVIGRGIRYHSHADLPEDQRNVAVEQYLSAMPERGALGKLVFGKPDMTADQYLYQMSKDKEALNQQLRAILATQQQPKA